MTTNSMTLLQFGLGLTSTHTDKVSAVSASTGTNSIEFYKLPRLQAELSVDEMFAQLELSDPRAAATTEAGTKWVAQTFFPEGPRTLANLRLRAGLSQRELGKRLNVTQPQIAKWERGDAPNMQIKTVQSLATALSVDLNELISALIGENKDERHER